MKRFFAPTVLLLLLAVPLWTGCRSNPSPTDSPLEPQPISTGVAEGTERTSPLPTPDLGDTPIQEVEPDPNAGIVRGRLQPTTSPSLLDEQPLYLSSIIQLDDAQASFDVVKIASTSDPRAYVEEDGSFIFTKIEPGNYALATVTPRGQEVLILDADSGKEIVIEVQAGEIVELGTFKVNLGY
jgi:hypothetical protein